MIEILLGWTIIGFGTSAILTIFEYKFKMRTWLLFGPLIWLMIIIDMIKDLL